jgi:HD-like signal output (HDOD) protein
MIVASDLNQSEDIKSAYAQLKEMLLKKSIDVPILPETANKVMALTQDPESNAQQLSAVIQSDPTIAGHVMRIANSSAYTPNSNLVSIQQAVTRLGMIEISNIAFLTSINSKIFKAPGYEKHIEVIWQHALATALWSKEVARAMRSNVEAAFLCGLLHSIGRPVILQTIAETEPLIGVLSDNQLEALFTKFESHYSKVVTTKWKLPETVATAINYHKNINAAPTQPELTATVAFGVQLASLMLNKARSKADEDSLLQSPALSLLNLYPDEVATLMTKKDIVKTAMSALSA